MKASIKLLAVLGTLVSLAAHAEVEIKKIAMVNDRAEWDKTNKVCYKSDGSTSCGKVAGMGEVKLLEDGVWSKDVANYLGSLSAEQLKDLSDHYMRINVRYLAIDEKNFSVQIFYIQNGEIEKSAKRVFGYSGAEALSTTMFALGTIDGSKATISTIWLDNFAERSREQTDASAKVIARGNVKDLGVETNREIVAKKQGLIDVAQTAISAYLAGAANLSPVESKP